MGTIWRCKWRWKGKYWRPTKYINGSTTNINLINADVNIDGVVDTYDYYVINSYNSGVITEFPYTGKVIILKGYGTESQLFATGETKALMLNWDERPGKAFQGWSTSSTGGVEYTDGANYTATENATLYAVWGLYGDANNDGKIDIGDHQNVYAYINGSTTNINLKNADVNIDGVIDTYDHNLIYAYICGQITEFPYTGKILVLDNLTKVIELVTVGETITLPLNEDVIDGYAFKGWSTTADGAVEYADGASYTANDNATLYAVWEEALLWNAPVLGAGMTPVNWNGSDWVATDEENWDYNYEIATAGHNTVAGDGTGKWANAMIDADGDGTLESSYVWLPRYSYKIEVGNHEDVDSWSSVDTPGTGKILVKFSKGTIDDTNDGYIVHPAFTFGTTEIDGMWVAKYEASRNDATLSSVGTGTTIISKPNVRSWRNLKLSDIFDQAYNMNRDLESHLMKNSEWGAVAYLTNAIGKIPYINNSYRYITGIANGAQDKELDYSSSPTNIWNTTEGVKGSTTHNVYGIYDLSGGAWEYVAAYVNNSSSRLTTYASSLLTSYNTYGNKYVDVYPIGSSDSRANNYNAWASIKGDALYETSTAYSSTGGAWDSDYSYAPYSSYPVLYRGGYYDDEDAAGIFAFYNAYGTSGDSYGFRTVFSLKAPPILATANGEWYTQGGTTISKESISSISILGNYIPTGTVVESWDGSKDKAGSITIYVEDDGRGAGTYKLTISGDGAGKIKVDSNCTGAFAGFSIADITGINILDTKNVTNMSNMFAQTAGTKILDLSNFDTSKVTNMNSMFMNCVGLTELNLSSFNTANVSDMSNMFAGNIAYLKKVILGEKFSFNGNGSTSCVLPTPSSTYITDADGNWYNTAGTAFTPANVPSNVADTYYGMKVISIATLQVGSYLKHIPTANVATTTTAYTDANFDDEEDEPEEISITIDKTMKWQVFSNNNGQIDIISEEIVGTLGVLGCTNSACTAMNSLSRQFVNENSSGGRHLGSSSLDGDVAIINTLVNGSYPLRCSATSYLAQTWHDEDYGEDYYDGFYTISSSGVLGHIQTEHHDWDTGKGGLTGGSSGIRPIISIKSSFKVVTGEGTANNPYVLVP